MEKNRKKTNIELQAKFSINNIEGVATFSNKNIIGLICFKNQEGNIKKIAPTAIKEVIPNIEIEEVGVYHSYKDNSFLKIGLKGDFTLTDLPLIGNKISSNINFAIKNVAGIFATGEIPTSQKGGKSIQKGVNIKLTVVLGKKEIPLLLNSGMVKAKNNKREGFPSLGIQENQTAENSGNVATLEIQKKLGPIYLKSIGLKFEDGKVVVLVSGSLTVASVHLGLEGLSVGVDMNKPLSLPSFDLRGLSLFYEKPNLSLGGAFLRNKTTYKNQLIDTYDGTVIIKTKTFSVVALGSYAEVEGNPSLFIYGVLNKPIGGPPFFFVTGVAAGFGINRGIKVPKVDKIHEFPLVAAAREPANITKDPFKFLQTYNTYLPPEEGQYFIAFGLKFTTFKLIDTFALLTLGFGKDPSLNVVGFSKLVLPPQKNQRNSRTLVRVELAFKASYDFKESAIKIDGILTPNSFLLSPDCELGGGFAFYAWTGETHKGDFVYTMGGYHHNFSVPAHYPSVPRLTFNWRINRNLSLRGSMYYALTPSACMAGGSLGAVWESGSLKAWFTLVLDLLLAWKPFHYEASLSVSVGASYTLRIKVPFLGKIEKEFSVDLSTEVALWGPKFSGTAKLKVGPFSIKIKFGAGDDRLPNPLNWGEFKQSFLPESHQVCTASVISGLLSTIKQTNNSPEINVVNPNDFEVAFETVIPITNTTMLIGKNSSTPSFVHYTDFGIGVMGLKKATSTIEIEFNNAQKNLDPNQVEITPVIKNVPAAMWGKAAKEGQYTKPSIQKGLIENVLVGVKITPKPVKFPDTTPSQDISKFLYDVELKEKAFQREKSFQKEESPTGVFTDIKTAWQKQRELLEDYDGVKEKIKIQNLHDVKGFSTAFLVPPKSINLKKAI